MENEFKGKKKLQKKKNCNPRTKEKCNIRKKIIIQNYNFQNEKAKIEPRSITWEANLIRS